MLNVWLHPFLSRNILDIFADTSLFITFITSRSFLQHHRARNWRRCFKICHRGYKKNLSENISIWSVSDSISTYLGSRVSVSVKISVFLFTVKNIFVTDRGLRLLPTYWKMDVAAQSRTRQVGRLGRGSAWLISRNACLWAHIAHPDI